MHSSGMDACITGLFLYRSMCASMFGVGRTCSLSKPSCSAPSTLRVIECVLKVRDDARVREVHDGVAEGGLHLENCRQYKKAWGAAEAALLQEVDQPASRPSASR